MIIKIDVNEMKHLKDRSCYNNNYYAYGNQGLVIYQHCDEEYDIYDYYILDGETEVFLGSASHEETDIDLMTMYT